MNELPVTVTKRQIQGHPQYRGTTMVDINISYPRVLTKGSPSGQVISITYDHVARRFYMFASRKMYTDAIQTYRDAKKNGFPFHPSEAVMTYEVPFNHGGLLSIQYDQYTYTGGAHGNTIRHADTWRVWDARNLTLNEFFYNAGYRNIIFRSIFAQIQQHPENYFEDYQKNVFQYYDPRNFYLTPQGFAFFFQLYTIAPYATGIPVFIVPYELFGELLKIRPV